MTKFSSLALCLISIPAFASGIVLSKGEQTIISGYAVSCEAPLLTEGIFETMCKADKDDKIERIKIKFVADINSSFDELNKKRDDYIKSTGNLESIYWCDHFYGPSPVKQ